MSSLQRVDSFGVVLPDGWIAVPTEPALFEQFVAGLRARWRQSPEWNRALERQAETLLARTRHELTRVGCVLAALYMDEVLDDWR